MRSLLKTLGVVPLFLSLHGAALADITVVMNGWDVLPQAQITQGRAGNCEANTTVWGPGRMTKGFSQTFSGAGSSGEDICYRRTADPLNPSSGWGQWGRCSSDGECQIP